MRKSHLIPNTGIHIVSLSFLRVVCLSEKLQDFKRDKIREQVRWRSRRIYDDDGKRIWGRDERHRQPPSAPRRIETLNFNFSAVPDDGIVVRLSTTRLMATLHKTHPSSQWGKKSVLSTDCWSPINTQKFQKLCTMIKVLLFVCFLATTHAFALRPVTAKQTSTLFYQNDQTAAVGIGHTALPTEKRKTLVITRPKKPTIYSISSLDELYEFLQEDDDRLTAIK